MLYIEGFRDKTLAVQGLDIYGDVTEKSLMKH